MKSRPSRLAVMIAGSLGTALILPGCGREEVEANVPEAMAPVAPPATETASMPSVRFVEITDEAGLDFVHCNSATGDKLLPETMGSGCAFFDYDSDGDQDLLLINQATWPWDADERAEDTPACRQALYRNDGKGHFENVTAESGLDLDLFGMGAVVGDYDNDGDPDLYITTLNGGRLLRNDQGRFVDVTEQAHAQAGDGWLSSGAFFDLENDGDLDLFLCCYVEWTREYDSSQNFQLTGAGRAYGPPTAFKGDFCVLLMNNGDGTFSDVSQESGIRMVSPELGDPLAKSLGVAPFDIDGDGFVDLAIANDTVRNFLFRNKGDGTFEELGIISGVSFDQSGSVRGAMGIDWAHFRNDDSLALAIANFANEMTAFYVSDDPKAFQFIDLANVFGLGAPTQPPLKFGLFFFDYDLDGRLDILSANGHLESDIEKTQASETYRQAAQLFWNSGQPGRSLYQLVGPDVAGPDLFTPIVGRGSTYADIDGDGDLDVLISSSGEKARLFRNDGGNNNHWVRLKLIGTKSNRDAIGAKVLVESDGMKQARQFFPAKGYLSSVEYPLTFGLKEQARANAVEIQWPSGEISKLGPLDADREYTIVEGEGLKP